METQQLAQLQDLALALALAGAQLPWDSTYLS